MVCALLFRMQWEPTMSRKYSTGDIRVRRSETDMSLKKKIGNVEDTLGFLYIHEHFLVPMLTQLT